jgi:hypothetical protein
MAMLVSSAAIAVTVTTPSDAVLGVQLQGDVINVAVAGTAAGVNNFPAGEAPNFSIDQVILNKYLNFGELFTGILVDASNDVDPVTGLQLVTGNDGPERDPGSFSIYGTNVSQSTTFSDYTPIVLDRTILETNPGRRAESDLITFPNTTVYDSYLVVFPTVRNAAGANSMQVSEIRLDAIPEPGTASLLGVAAIGFAARRRRRP